MAVASHAPWFRQPPWILISDTGFQHTVHSEAELVDIVPPKERCNVRQLIGLHVGNGTEPGYKHGWVLRHKMPWLQHASKELAEPVLGGHASAFTKMWAGATDLRWPAYRRASCRS